MDREPSVITDVAVASGRKWVCKVIEVFRL